MSSLKYIFLLIAVVMALLRAQEMEPMTDMDLEAVEGLPLTERSGSDDTKNEAMVSEEDQSESIPTKSDPNSNEETKESNNESNPDISETTAKASEESPEGQTESMAILFQEIEDRLTEPKSEDSSQPSVVQTSTDSSVISQFNGLDVDKSGSTFSCYGKAFGQYADVQKECRVFHLCYPYFNSTTDELLYQRISFLCDNDSVFDQKRFICVDNSTIEHKCSDSEDLYLQTNQEYLIRVFSQSVSPIDEVKGQPTQGSNRNWMNWFGN